MNYQDKDKILNALNEVFNEYEQIIKQQESDLLFKNKGNKWNNAQIIDHLAITLGITAVGFASPKFVLKNVGGKLERTKRNYNEVVFQYQLQLNDGGKAPVVYLPKISMLKNKQLLLNFWIANKNFFIKSVATWKNKDLDAYNLPHPLLGKCTIREMLYFTVYHSKHHLLQMD